MKIFVSIFFAIIFLLFSIKDARAIIAVIPTALIPIVHIVVVVIGVISMPVVAINAIYFKIKKKSPTLGAAIGLGLLFLLGILLTTVFKLINPLRPLY